MVFIIDKYPPCSKFEEKCGSFRKLAVLGCKGKEPPIRGIVECGYCIEPGKGVFTVKIVCSPLECCLKKIKTPLAPEAELFRLLMKLGKDLLPYLKKHDIEDILKMLPEEKVDELAFIDMLAKYFPWVFKVQPHGQQS